MNQGWSTQLTDFSYTDFTVKYGDALDRLHVRLSIILFYITFGAVSTEAILVWPNGQP